MLQRWRREGSPQVVVVDDGCQCLVVIAEGHGGRSRLLVYRIEGELEHVALEAPPGEAGDLADGVGRLREGGSAILAKVKRHGVVANRVGAILALPPALVLGPCFAFVGTGELGLLALWLGMYAERQHSEKSKGKKALHGDYANPADMAYVARTGRPRHRRPRPTAGFAPFGGTRWDGGRPEGNPMAQRRAMGHLCWW